MIATAISEIARNITSYAGSRRESGSRVADRDGRRRWWCVPRTTGPGIVDIDRALEDGYSTGRGLGLGLPGARTLDGPADRRVGHPGNGTVVEMWKWIPPSA